MGNLCFGKCGVSHCSLWAVQPYISCICKTQCSNATEITCTHQARVSDCCPIIRHQVVVRCNGYAIIQHRPQYLGCAGAVPIAFVPPAIVVPAVCEPHILRGKPPQVKCLKERYRFFSSQFIFMLQLAAVL